MYVCVCMGMYCMSYTAQCVSCHCLSNSSSVWTHTTTLQTQDDGCYRIQQFISIHLQLPLLEQCHSSTKCISTCSINLWKWQRLLQALRKVALLAIPWNTQLYCTLCLTPVSLVCVAAEGWNRTDNGITKWPPWSCSTPFQRGKV